MSEKEPTTAVELFEVLPEEPVVSSKLRLWNGITAEYYHHHPNSLASPMLQEHLVTVNCGHPYNLIQRLSGRVHEGRVVKGNIILTPAGHPTEWTWQNAVDVLHLGLTDAFVAKVASEALEVNYPALTPLRSSEDGALSQISPTLLRLN